MPDFSINNQSKLGDIQRSYQWIIDINPPQSVKDAMGMIEDIELNDLSLRCRSSSIPGKSFDTITAKHYGAEIFFAGQVHYTNTMNFVFEEFVSDDEKKSRKIAKCFYAWQELVLNAITNNGNKSSYTANGLLIFLKNNDIDFKGIQEKFNSINLYNMWPETIAEIPLSYGDNNSVQYSIGFRYDYWDYV